MSDLETRIQHLEDREAIRRLKHYYYCHCVDLAVAGDANAIKETISRFADDMVADFTGLPLMAIPLRRLGTLIVQPISGRVTR
jgi:hypothetical protein